MTKKGRRKGKRKPPKNPNAYYSPKRGICNLCRREPQIPGLTRCATCEANLDQIRALRGQHIPYRPVLDRAPEDLANDYASPHDPHP